MSYVATTTSQPYFFIKLSANTNISSSYGTTSATNGFNFDISLINVGNITWSTSTYAANIPVKGLYLVSYSYDVTNQNTDTGNIFIDVGISLTRNTSVTAYSETTNPEITDDGVYYNVSNTVVISCEVDDKIKGYINKTDSTVQTVLANSSMSIVLIAPFS